MKSGLDAIPLFLLDDLLMRKLYEIFKVLKIQKRIVSTETICGNRVYAGASTYLDRVAIIEPGKALFNFISF